MQIWQPPARRSEEWSSVVLQGCILFPARISSITENSGRSGQPVHWGRTSPSTVKFSEIENACHTWNPALESNYSCYTCIQWKIQNWLCTHLIWVVQLYHRGSDAFIITIREKKIMTTRPCANNENLKQTCLNVRPLFVRNRFCTGAKFLVDLLVFCHMTIGQFKKEGRGKQPCYRDFLMLGDLQNKHGVATEWYGKIWSDLDPPPKFSVHAVSKPHTVSKEAQYAKQAFTPVLTLRGCQ